MSGPDWQKVVACLASFFPTMAERLTDAQAREWRREVDSIDCDAVCAAIGKAYRTDSNTWPTPRGIATLARPQADKFRGTYRQITGPICTPEEIKEQARIGLEMMRRRREKQMAEQSRDMTA